MRLLWLFRVDLEDKLVQFCSKYSSGVVSYMRNVKNESLQEQQLAHQASETAGAFSGVGPK